jgi:hypothetical protein
MPFDPYSRPDDIAAAVKKAMRRSFVLGLAVGTGGAILAILTAGLFFLQ